MINKKGFTLAEVLLVMAIVAIIVVLTLPALYKNSKKSVIGSSLAKTVETIENGMKNIINETSNNNTEGRLETLSSIKKSDIGLDGDTYITDDNTFYDATSSWLGIETTTYDINSIKNYDNSNPEEDSLSDFSAYKLKKINSVVMFHNVSNDNVATANNDEIISKVIIDANGAEKPNKFGEDIFIFGLTNDGQLIPAGTKKYKSFDNSVETGACSGENIGNGTACAARVMADKWEIKY